MPSLKLQEKLVYSLEDVSRLTRVDVETVAAWEKEFPFLRAGSTGSGKKIFRQKDVAIIQRLKVLLDKKGYTLAGAKRKIEEEFGLRTPGELHPDKIKKALLQVRDELQEMLSLLDKDPKKG
ncbi:MAG: MerR family transcriptional regulator [Candidatus Aminicenantes bacterium]|nr:MerR family transcriptional regulator [Candidatus Aminicenantes bacterium]